MIKDNKKKSLTLILRNYFITGIVVLIPIGFTLYLTKFIIGISSNIIPQNINPNSYLPYAIPGIEILISIIFITLVGGLSLSFLGKRVLKFIDDLFKKIPFLRTIYSAILPPGIHQAFLTFLLSIKIYSQSKPLVGSLSFA